MKKEVKKTNDKIDQQDTLTTLRDDTRAYIKKRAKKLGLSAYIYVMQMGNINYQTVGITDYVGEMKNSHEKVLFADLRTHLDKT